MDFSFRGGLGHPCSGFWSPLVAIILGFGGSVVEKLAPANHRVDGETWRASAGDRLPSRQEGQSKRPEAAKKQLAPLFSPLRDGSVDGGIASSRRVNTMPHGWCQAHLETGHAALGSGKAALSVQPAPISSATSSTCASSAITKDRQGWVGASALAPALPTTRSPASSIRSATP